MLALSCFRRVPVFSVGSYFPSLGGSLDWGEGDHPTLTAGGMERALSGHEYRAPLVVERATETRFPQNKTQTLLPEP